MDLRTAINFQLPVGHTQARDTEPVKSGVSMNFCGNNHNVLDCRRVRVLHLPVLLDFWVLPSGRRGGEGDVWLWGWSSYRILEARFDLVLKTNSKGRLKLERTPRFIRFYVFDRLRDCSELDCHVALVTQTSTPRVHQVQDR